jgi:AraC-like DNA-binding protein
MEIIFNLGRGSWQIASGNRFTSTPSIELWGQITKPLFVKSTGQNTMLGVRFFPHAASCFIPENIEVLNNQVCDFRDVSDNSANELYAKILEATTWNKRIVLLEEFLTNKLSRCNKKAEKIAVITNVMEEISHEDFFDNIENVASRYGITSRYLQKIFLQYTGLTPKLYSKINRFQNSLKLISKKDTSLTSIAYDCGYFDQSHFIREFKSFTGFTPSGYTSHNSPITFAFANS